MESGSHAHAADPRNADVLIHVNGRLVPRPEATVSVFDSGFLLGDGVWEGIRLHNGQLVFIDEHMDRLYEAAKAIDLDIGLARDELVAAIEDTCRANAMDSGVHIRLVVSRGEKSTPYQSPAANLGGPTIVIIPEWKEPDPGVLERGMTLFTVHVHRGPPDVQDPMLELAVEAQLHRGLHPGAQGRRGRGPHAGPARLRRHLQLDPLLRRARPRALDLERSTTACDRHHPPAQCSMLAAASRATPCARRTSR
ncbi:MAG: aminotransferase class IV [Halofilum sp. (in: g-proteobacteria)]|nr:aminotransferase class IV [Halofilum sp. (in: g-proteobacteria)]